jgi:hypothetical protein
MLPPTLSKASTLDRLSADYSASEDDGDTVSLSLDSTTGIAMSMGTESQNPNTQASDWMGSRASSATPPHRRIIPSVLSPSVMSVEQSSSWQSPNPEAGYFVLPDPLPSSASVVTSPVAVGSSSATPTGSARCVVEDTIATELCGSPRLKSVRGARNPPLDAMATAEESDNHFLPLLKDESNYPNRPSVNVKLSNISKHPTDTQSLAKENAAHPNAKLQPSGIHPAFRQPNPHTVSHDEQMMALHTEFESITNDLKGLIQSTSSRNHRLSEDVERLQKNQDRLLRGWEGMRNELLELKRSQQQLRRCVKSTREEDEQALQSARPSMASTGLRGLSFASPARRIREDAGLQGPTSKVPDALAPYLRGRTPPRNHTSTLLPDARAHEGRQSAKGHTITDTMSAPSMQVDSQKLQQRIHHAEHVRQYPKGCKGL